MSPAKSLVGTLTGRDLINVGIFSTIYFALMFIPGMLGLINPVFSIVGYVIGVLANGVVVALYLSRVPKLGALTIPMGILGLLMVLSGSVWYALLLTPILGLGADLIARSGKYRKPLRNVLAYAVITLWQFIPMLPLAFDEASYRDYVSLTMGESYADVYLNLFSPANLVWFGIGFFLTGIAGGAFGQRLLGQHFRRAGVA